MWTLDSITLLQEHLPVLNCGWLLTLVELSNGLIMVVVIVVSITLLLRSTLRQSQPNKAGLKCPSVCTCEHACVRAYVRPITKSFLDFNEIWRVCRGR